MNSDQLARGVYNGVYTGPIQYGTGIEDSQMIQSNVPHHVLKSLNYSTITLSL